MTKHREARQFIAIQIHRKFDIIITMTANGYVKGGQVLLDAPARLPEGARVHVRVVDSGPRIAKPLNRAKLARFKPIELPGGSLAEELVRDRR